LWCASAGAVIYRGQRRGFLGLGSAPVNNCGYPILRSAEESNNSTTHLP
jgi:hypothetical protein